MTTTKPYRIPPKLEEPFIADDTFMSGWHLVYGDSPVCTKCNQTIKQGESVVWEINGHIKSHRHAKHLVHAKHREGQNDG
jgi:hypothetical protein